MITIMTKDNNDLSPESFIVIAFLEFLDGNYFSILFIPAPQHYTIRPCMFRLKYSCEYTVHVRMRICYVWSYEYVAACTYIQAHMCECEHTFSDYSQYFIFIHDVRVLYRLPSLPLPSLSFSSLPFSSLLFSLVLDRFVLEMKVNDQRLKWSEVKQTKYPKSPCLVLSKRNCSHGGYLCV